MTAVLSCHVQKICSDLMASNWVTAIQNFHWIWTSSKKSFVTLAPGLLQQSLEFFKIFLPQICLFFYPPILSIFTNVLWQCVAFYCNEKRNITRLWNQFSQILIWNEWYNKTVGLLLMSEKEQSMGTLTLNMIFLKCHLFILRKIYL